ncbi:carboxypeptidase-like regulatory domain-containing protein [Terracidiphilus sp.]|uniref:carboxypeptidase-like regulatory domain-containing protein n=1 Tax=Terracidiphilus sp. TaxID=1964191 RepID=UPI003C160D4F
MYYDSGRPFWPCEVPTYTLGSLNVLPVALARLVSNVWTEAPPYFVYAVELPLILLWWWFLGTRLDFGLLDVGVYRRRRTWLGALSAATVLLLGLLGKWVWDEIRFRQAYASLEVSGSQAYLRIVKDLPICLWMVALISALSFAIFKLAGGKTGGAGQALASPRTKSFAILGFATYGVCAACLFLHEKSVERQRQAEYDLRSLIVRGSVVDDRGKPVEAIEISLVPLLDDSDAQAQQAVQDFTDKTGEYIIRPEKSGRYFLSVLWNAPPSPKLPFLTLYYPEVSEQSHAEILDLTRAKHLSLAPIKLNRLELTKVRVSVFWLNGRPEPNAYVFFHNSLYPKYGSIGNEAFYPDEDGTVSLPAGFDYRANAQVDCDCGKTIENEYSPEVTFSTKRDHAPVEPLQLILPGNPCQIWHSK